MTADLLPHLARALSVHARWLVSQGITPPADVLSVAHALTVLSGLPRPTGDVLPPPSDAPAVRLLDEMETARCLSLSPRTVRRLLASGELPSLLVGRSRRVHVDDLDDYLQRLRTRS